MSLSAIALRVLFTYVFMCILVRLSRKRTISEGSALDFVVALLLGDMLDDLFWGDVPAAVFVAGTGTVMFSHVLMLWISYKFPAVAYWTKGACTVVAGDGDFNREGMRKERMSPTDLMAILRQESVSDLREVKAAEVHVSGEPAVIPRDWADEAQKLDLDRARERLREGPP
jgi:uncharacterized membrane protein YcaP (DUF421 family)